MRIGISTGGGDAPGLNAAIRGAVLAARQRGWEMVGIRRGFNGLLDETPDLPVLDRGDVRGIAHLGGTILGTTNRGNPFRWAVTAPDGTVQERDLSDQLIARAREHGLDAVIVIGGDGSLGIGLRLWQKGLPVVGVPKTIDNDVGGTATTIGFDTAVSIATEAIDRLHTTAESHERVMVVEVMGRNAGWIALHSGMAAGADVILMPEIPFDFDTPARKILERDRSGRRFSIVVVAEGVQLPGGGLVTREGRAPGRTERLGGVGERVAAELAKRTGKEVRALALGHLQRGGPPTMFDRLMGLRFGTAAIRAVADGRFGTMVAYVPPRVKPVPLEEALAVPKRVGTDSDTVLSARDMGICLGD